MGPAVAEKDSSSGPVPGEKAEQCTDHDERRGKNEFVAHLEGYPGHGCVNTPCKDRDWCQRR